nr:hypothetical protein 1 [bacterium]
MIENTVTIKHCYISSSQFIKEFQKELANILKDPVYPDQVHLLAESFNYLASKALLEIDNQYRKFIDLDTDSIKSDPRLAGKYSGQYFQKEKQRAFIQIKIIFKYFKYLAELTRYILSSTIETAPIGLLYPFQKFIQNLFPKSYIFLRKQWKHNYKFGEFVTQILDPAEKPDYFDSIRDEFNFRLSMVSYPSLEDDNYLYNCNIAHEIGHYIDDLSQLTVKEKTFLKKEVYLDDIDLEASDLRWATLVTLKWHEEFIADIYATFLLGPAYLFSFLEFHSTKNIDEFGLYKENEHPSARMRLYYIQKTLSYEKHNVKEHLDGFENGWFKHVAKLLEQYEQWVHQDRFSFRNPDEEENTIARLAWTANKKICEIVVNYAYDIVFPLSDQNPAYEINLEKVFNPNVLFQVKKKLLVGIPINELYEINEDGENSYISSYPINIYGILNYGWMYFFELMELENDDINDLDKSVQNLKALIKRSVEASYFHHQYSEQRTRLQV